MGAAYNQKFYCAATAAAGNCQSGYTGTYGVTAGTAGAASINTVNLYVAISIWSVSSTATTDFTAACDTGTVSTASCFTLQWVKGTWSTVYNGLSAPASMTAATAADSLTGIVGAQALAASAAAAFTAAAALY
jgi:hypothetical protein